MPRPRADEIVVTWIGHATFLLQSERGNVLIDPVFSDRASPFTWIGPRRAQPPGVALDALPPLHAVLLSHDHYDHCDLHSLREIARRHRDAIFVTPLRHRDLLTAAGARRIVELDWWQTRVLDSAPEIRVTLTPSKHWSNRFGTPRNHRLWGGFYLEFECGADAVEFSVLDSRASNASSNGLEETLPIEIPESEIENLPAARRVWFAGDTGYDAEIFQAIRARCGAPDLALIPIGAYEPRWFMAPMHVNPAEAVQIHRDVGARQSLGMHWGTFQLTDEGRDDPPEALALARAAGGLKPDDFRVVAPGESIVV